MENFKFEIDEPVIWVSGWYSNYTIKTRFFDGQVLYSLSNTLGGESGSRVPENELLSLKSPKMVSLYKSACAAYRNISQNPERRAWSTVKDYGAELAQDMESIPAEEREQYESKYLSMLHTYLGSLSNCASAFVVGPAKFPTARMEKRNAWADNHYNKFRYWREQALKYIGKKYAPVINPIEDIKSRIAERQAMQERMKSANALIRKNPPDLAAQLVALGFEQVEKKIQGDFMGRKGFADYQLQNNNAEIKRLQTRLKELESKQAAAQSGNKETMNGDIKVIENYEVDRIQLIFPDKPAEEVRTALKSYGFKWSPRFGAWQRQLTDMGRIGVERFFNAYNKMSHATI